MGFVEETGAAQYLRDVRITPIYEGTTGIQANDLVGRKTRYDGGQGVEELIADMQGTLDALKGSQDEACHYAAAVLERHMQMVTGASQKILEEQSDVLVAGVANDYLMLMGYSTGCWAMARSVLGVSNHEDDSFKALKRSVCRFYFDAIAPHAEAHFIALQNTDEAHFALPAEAL